MNRRGCRIHVDSADARAQELVRAGGDLAPGSSRLWNAALSLQPWDLVVDIGANYGEMLLGSALPETARVVAYEPSPHVLPFLRRSLDESGLEVDVRSVAVGAHQSHADFVLDTVWSGRSGLAATHRTDADHELETVTVPVRTLDSELAAQEWTSVCVKVDVEGAEFAVLEGASDMLSGGRPWAMMLEILHMSPFEKATLAGDFSLRVMDRRTGNLVIVPPASAQRVEAMISSGWVHPQDAIVMSRDNASHSEVPQ